MEKLWLSTVPGPSGPGGPGQAHDGTETDVGCPAQTLSFDGSFQLDGTPPSLCLP